MQRLCRFLIPCAAVVATVPAAAAAFHAMPVVDAGRVAAEANGQGPVAGGMARAFLSRARALNGLNDRDVCHDLPDPAAGSAIADADADADATAIDSAGPSATAACRAGACHAAPPDAVPAVPAPSMLALLGAGLALLGWRRPQAWGFTRLAPRCPG